MKIAIRVDVSFNIGSGHFMRCLTLADYLKKQGASLAFISRHISDTYARMLKEKGIELRRLNYKNKPLEVDELKHASWLGVSQLEDARATIDAISDEKWNWIIVDHYALDSRWESALRGSTEKIMVIDDLADRNHECVLLLDQNLGRIASDYDDLVSKNCLKLIGPQYALLRPEFVKFRERSLKRRERPELKRIQISLGGVDRTNMTGQVLDVLSETKLSHDTHLDIIMGDVAPYLDRVHQQAERLPFNVTVSTNVTNMAERMYLADMSIGAGGATSWERCCLGLPTIMLIIAENQTTGAKALEASGAALTILKTKMLISQIAKLDNANYLKRMSIAAAGLTDGLGILRVTESMMSYKGIA